MFLIEEAEVMALPLDLMYEQIFILEDCHSGNLAPSTLFGAGTLAILRTLRALLGLLVAHETILHA